ncbi:hypothetical protein OG394_29085 [Kribbella sp. NBC_01245]|uniref:hypothetical protein n=1 Tax=Kribbella sp. NBC_01245 TaxID=2903578 RepID=UPI002E282FDF|nr:hypothetical protein [Kribbella sp. NBC_01245]
MRYDLFISPWIDHHAWRIVFTAYAGQIAYTTIDLLADLPHRFSSELGLLWLSTVVYAAAALFLHARGPLCERCIGEMPYDGSARAERYRWSLATFHWLGAHQLGWMAGVAAVAVLVSLTKRSSVIPEQAETFVFAVPAMWVMLSLSRHSRLQLWCPQCPTEGGGREHRSPIGSPTPRLALQLPGGN